MQHLLHYTMKKLIIIQKEYRKLNLLLICMIGKTQTFHHKKKDWNTFEKNNRSIALNIFYVPYNTKQIRPAYIPKYNWDRKNQANLLMITDGGEKWHYLAIISIRMLFRGITSKNNGNTLTE